jgi:rubrerythrin
MLRLAGGFPPASASRCQMSFLSRLKKLVDPLQSHDDRFARLDDELPAIAPPVNLPSVAETEEPPPSNGEEPEYECKVCGLLADDPTYCPRCLAYTMQHVPPRRP